MTKHTIQMNPVQLSLIEAIGYHPETKTLAITFKRGGVYHYANVSQDQYDALRTAKSVGGNFLGSAIKNDTAAHPFTKQPPVQTTGGETQTAGGQPIK